MQRIGLFGGSFDPVHLGHLLVAQAAMEELALARLYFIPAAQSPFKPERKLTPDKIRLQMLRTALAGRTHCEVDPQELERGGVSYSIDTVRVMFDRDKIPMVPVNYDRVWVVDIMSPSSGGVITEIRRLQFYGCRGIRILSPFC